MSKVFLRQDVLDSLTQLTINGTVRAVEDQQTLDTFINFLLGVVSNNQVRDGVLESLMYAPMRGFFTFGYAGKMAATEKQAKFEMEMDEKRRKVADSYIEDRTQRNSYPGLNKRMNE